MNVYDKAYELAKALEESHEAKAVQAARAAADADPDARRMLFDFQKRQVDLQQRMMSGDEPSAEELENLNRLYELLSMNPLVQRYFEAEKRLSVVVEDVNRIIGNSLSALLLS
ncbi:YlbF family regulator [Paenibacillus pasadenensis]|uniref:YlbF family regulator n=1 Tax=Paenibacillus pasadenensis TaxID=217090 RepID=UPI002041E8FC|nr:YlbF family regulator [Paenibacillus pasadenensis]MCM3747987.1 YlbF family regulator [Paenibacillus pasadenensis]